MNNKILMLINEFPPVAESGVQRPLKFLKYLAKEGWESYVITPQRPTKSVIDESLLSEIPSNTKISKTLSWGIHASSEAKLSNLRFDYDKTKSLSRKLVWNLLKTINDFFLPIDKQIGWVPFAVIKAIKLINQHKIRNVYITAYPYSAFICGLILKIFYGSKIYWIADYRDAWQFAPMLESKVFSFRFKLICKIDEMFLKSSDFVVFTSPVVNKWYTNKYDWLINKSATITNGYDEDDFTDIQDVPFNKFTFFYMGKIHPLKGNPFPLLKIVKQSMSVDFQYIHCGTISTQLQQKIKDNGYDFYKFEGYKTHSEVLMYAANADINIVIINNDPASVGVFPGKVFELMRCGKPIFAVGPEKSVVRDLLERTNTGLYAFIDDNNEIKLKLDLILSGKFQVNASISEFNEFSREKTTEKLISIYLNHSK